MQGCCHQRHIWAPEGGGGNMRLTRAQLLADDFALVLEEMRVDPLAGDDINFLVVLLVEDFQADVALFREEFPPERSTRPGYNMR